MYFDWEYLTLLALKIKSEQANLLSALPDQYLKVHLGADCLLLTSPSHWALCIWLITFTALQGAACRSNHVWYFCNDSSRGSIIILLGGKKIIMELRKINFMCDMYERQQEKSLPGLWWLKLCPEERWRVGISAANPTTQKPGCPRAGPSSQVYLFPWICFVSVNNCCVRKVRIKPWLPIRLVGVSFFFFLDMLHCLSHTMLKLTKWA